MTGHRGLSGVIALTVGCPKAIGATRNKQAIDGKTYQRWSRHRTAQNPWKAGFDGLETHVYLIEDWLVREFEK